MFFVFYICNLSTFKKRAIITINENYKMKDTYSPKQNKGVWNFGQNMEFRTGTEHGTWNGTGTEHGSWNGTGTENGTWNRTGTELERNWNETGTELERNWNGTGTELEQNMNHGTELN